MDEIVSKLTDINNTLNGVVAVFGIYMILSMFAFVVLFFWYYDVNKKEERKRLRKQIEREIKEESCSHESKER